MGNKLNLIKNTQFIENDDPNYLKFGHSQFQQSFFTEVLPCLTPSQISLIKLTDWDYINANQNWVQVIKFLEKTQTTKIKLRKHVNQPHYSAFILNQISHISFKSILRLDLTDNGICSIQAVAFLDMPEIKEFMYADNFVTSDKPLAKTKWIKIQALVTSNNKANGTNVSRTYGKKLIHFLSYSGAKEYNQMQDPRLLVKIESPKMNMVLLSLQKTIQSQEVHKALVRRLKTDSIS